jgi:hypothetical protein
LEAVLLSGCAHAQEGTIVTSDTNTKTNNCSLIFFSLDYFSFAKTLLPL